MKNTTALVFLKTEKLLNHPKNMRKFYPTDQVREMANSILANDGVLEPLIITKTIGNKWIVIDGNMRLAGGRLLAEKCPPLECKVVNKSEADQLLTMITANQVRYDVDPVSEAIHYKALQAEGLSIRQISKRTGVYEARINNRIMLAELETPIQKLIIDGKLPTSSLVANALLKLTPATRVKLAERIAKNPSMKITSIVNACESLAAHAKPKKRLKHPAAELSGAASTNTSKITATDIRNAARKICDSCNQFEGQLAKGQSPAWSMIVHSANEICGDCDLKDIQKICDSCPAVELLRRIVASKETSHDRR